MFIYLRLICFEMMLCSHIFYSKWNKTPRNINYNRWWLEKTIKNMRFIPGWMGKGSPSHWKMGDPSLSFKDTDTLFSGAFAVSFNGREVFWNPLVMGLMGWNMLLKFFQQFLFCLVQINPFLCGEFLVCPWFQLPYVVLGDHPEHPWSFHVWELLSWYI